MKIIKPKVMLPIPHVQILDLLENILVLNLVVLDDVHALLGLVNLKPGFKGSWFYVSLFRSYTLKFLGFIAFWFSGFMVLGFMNFRFIGFRFNGFMVSYVSGLKVRWFPHYKIYGFMKLMVSEIAGCEVSLVYGLQV